MRLIRSHWVTVPDGDNWEIRLMRERESVCVIVH